MKILNNENGVNKLYIQVNDIINISHLYKLKYELLEDILNNNKMNNDFIEISNSADIDLLNKFDWIIDFKKYKNISFDEYNLIYQDYIREISRLNKEMIYHNRKNNIKDIIEQIDILSGQIRDLFAILQNRYTDKKINLPIISDSDKDWYKVNNYIIKPSLDPNSIIIENDKLHKKDFNKDVINLFNEIMKINDKNFNQDIYSDYSLLNINDTSVLITFKYNKKEIDKQMKKAKLI